MLLKEQEQISQTVQSEGCVCDIAVIHYVVHFCMCNLYVSLCALYIMSYYNIHYIMD